jgi:type IV pilus assembly protein PilE
MSGTSSKVHGFTLIELLVAILITALLASLAYPSYSEQVNKARRADAWDALSRLQLAQERHRSHFTSFATSVRDLALPELSPAAHYRLHVAESDAFGYVIEAEVVAGSPQAQDRHCQRLRVTMHRGVQRRQAFAEGGTESTHRCFVA